MRKTKPNSASGVPACAAPIAAPPKTSSPTSTAPLRPYRSLRLPDASTKVANTRL